MAEKSKFSSSPIPWFLVLKILGVVTLWFSLGRLIGIFSGLFLYFFPWRESGKMFLGFLLWIVFAYLLPQDFVGGIWLGCFLLILIGLKNSLFEYPRLIYQILLLLMSAIGFYFWFSWASTMPLFSLLPVAIVIGLLISFVVWHFLSFDTKNTNPQIATEKILISGVIGFLLAEINLVALLIPLNPTLQGGLLFLSVAVLLQLADDYIGKRRSIRYVLRTLFVFCAGFIILVAANEWHL